MYDFVTWFFRPYTLLLVCLIVALVRAWWLERECRRRLVWLIIPLLALISLSTPTAAFLALGSLEWSYPPTERTPNSDDVVIVLTGSMSIPDRVRRKAELGESSLYRSQHTAELYKRGAPQLVIVSGGKVDANRPGPACSEVMRDYLIQLGVEPSHILVEAGSRNTYESAVACRELLRSQPHDGVFLVTEATHMARSHACFRAQGIEVVPAPCHHRATEFRWSIWEFLPSSSGLNTVETAAHEWIGMIWYWLKGRI